MFSKKSKSKNASDGAPVAHARDIALLREAVDRNTSIGVVHQSKAGFNPLAQGRLLRWDDDGIVIEELQIIGRDVRFGSGDTIEAYLTFEGVMLSFDGTVLMVEEPMELNSQRIVRSLELTSPQNLRESDRRSAFRASVSGQSVEIPVDMWFLDRYVPSMQGEEKIEFVLTNTYYTNLLAALNFDADYPLDDRGEVSRDIDWGRVLRDAKGTEPHAVGRLIDLTRNGLGMLMYGVSNMQLDRFERVGVSFELEGEQLDLVVELRRGTDVKGSTCRVGMLIVHPEQSGSLCHERRVLEQFAMQVQREQLRNRKAS